MSWGGNWKSGGGSWGGGGGYGGGGGSWNSQGSGKGNSKGSGAGKNSPAAGMLKPTVKPSNSPAPIAVKKEPGVSTSTPAVKPSPNNPNGKTPVFTVSTQSKTKDEIGVQTLVGDYIEIGSNHARKYYQKVQEIPGHKDVKVFLYYWDMRDGAEFAGWWFGDAVGGSQVWARCNAHGNVPPPAGWKIPWDAPKAEAGLLNVNAYKASASSTAAPVAAGKAGGKGTASAASTAGVGAAGIEARVKKASTQVDTLEKSAKELGQKAKGMTKETAVETLDKLKDTLTGEQNKLTEAQKSLTQDIAEARKGGPSTLSSVTELSKLSPRLRTSSSLIATELSKIKGFLTLAQNSKKAAADKEQQKKLEEKQAKELSETLPAFQELVNAAEDMVEAVCIMAAPIINDPPEDAGASLKKVMDDIEKSATDAQNKLNETRQKISTKLQAARNMAPETRKKALAEYTSLQGKLAEAQKKLNPYKNFKKDFQARVDAKKAVKDLIEKLGSAELEVEKAAMMTTGLDQSAMSEDDVKTAEGLVSPARSALASVNSLIEGKLKGASGPMRDELGELKTRLAESQKKVSEVAQTLKSQRELLQLEGLFTTANEKVDKAEESLDKCGEAELSFLKGIEVLPQEESEKAIKESEAASAQSSQLLSQAKGFLSQKLQEVRKYSEKTSKKATAELSELMKRCEVVQKKLTTFKTETKERKIAALMAEAIDAVVTAEGKIKTLTDAAKIFSADNLEKTSVDTLKAAGEKTSSADKECSAAVSEARKIVSLKQKTASNDTAQGLTKLLGRINVVQQEQTKIKKAAAMGDKLVKGRAAQVEAEAKLDEVEVEVAKVVKMSKPEDEGLGVERISDDSILDIDTLCTTVSKSLRVVNALVQSHLATAPPALKSSFQTMSERSKKAESSISDVKSRTKDQRERVLSESFVKEGLAKTLEIEAALEKTAEAEMPYLKGVEVLPPAESKAAMEAADEACKVVGAAINAARTVIASKNLEIKKFDSKNAKGSSEELTKLTERVNSAAQKLGVFKKDTAIRKKRALMQEAGEMVTVTEAEIAKVGEAMKPIMEKDPDALSPEEASAMIKSLEEIETKATKQMTDCRNFLSERLRDAAGDGEKIKQVKEYQAKLSEANVELTKAKKLSGSHNDKLRAKALIQESADKAKEAEAELEKATAACAPILEEKCERFLVKSSIATMCKALLAHMDEKSLSEEAMHKEMGKPLKQDKFVDFVGKIPEAFKREECAFSEERRIAMFKSIDEDADGVVNIDEFKAMFSRKYTCINGIAVTDGFDIGSSKTLCKLEAGEVVECRGEPKKGEGEAALPRMQIKSKGTDGNWGWVTTQGNNGTRYLAVITPFKEFTSNLEKTLDSHTAALNKIFSFYSSKMKELAEKPKDSPLQAAKEQLAKERGEVSKVTAKIKDLKGKIHTSRAEFARMEQKEKNAHIEAKEQKEADEILIVVRPAFEKLEASLTKLEEVSKPLTEKYGTDVLQEFATPLSVQDEAKAAQTALNEVVDEVKSKGKEQQEKLAKAQKGPLLEAKKELGQWLSKASQAQATGHKAAQRIKVCCKSIAKAKLALLVSAMQAEYRASGASLADFFKKFAAGGDRISEETFVKHAQKLKGLELPKEHATLATRQIEAGGISYRSFMRLLQKYMKVTREIAITPGFEIIGSKDRPVRKAELEEVFEILEGPKTDEGSGLERVRVRALVDSAEGWVSVKGNQGKTFLESVEKPFYQCLKDASLESDFDSGSALKQTLKADEILELVEGPRKESLGSVMRLRGKAVNDGKVGWFTVKDKSGKVFAEKGSKCYTCTATVAITDVCDIKACKVLKKLAVDDVFTISEGPIGEEGGCERVKGKGPDGVEGWITIKGNAGTVYAKVNEKLYTVAQDVAMHSQFKSDSSEVRVLVAGEAIEATEAPREEKFVPTKRAKVRTSGGAEGWVSVKEGFIRAWSPNYKCAKASKLYSAKGSKDTVVREIAAGETLDLQEGPVEVEGAMWLRCSMKKDGAEGWTPLKGEDGSKLIVN